MICFILYTTYDLEHYQTYVKEERIKESKALRILIWIFVAYFIINETRQCIISGLKHYLSNVWNYMD
jgi:hypothetical protein